jgi:hypothetical protein
MRRPQNGRMERTGLYPEIVDKTPPSRQERCILDAFDRLTTPCGRCCGHSRTILQRALLGRSIK